MKTELNSELNSDQPRMLEPAMSEPSSLATPARTVPAYEALAADIKARGVTAVFGLMSDDTALFCTALDAIGVRFYGDRKSVV